MDNSSIRTQLLLIGIFVLIVGILGFLFITAPEPVNIAPDGSVVNFDEIRNEQQEVTTIIGVLSKTGTQVKVRDFYGDEGVVLFDEKEKTYLIGEEKGANGPIYQIFYFAGGGVTVSLQNEKLNFARSRAEEDLQKKLGLSLLDMCSLSVRVTVPGFVSDDFSGRDLGLSFCPGSEVLP
ncbi:hypothetical protein KC926_03750 [Candidatus Kaiserbacteria bacterium]|nr:hypothetical protein [Candidatus Kaiserbacteria bacterium]